MQDPKIFTIFWAIQNFYLFVYHKLKKSWSKASTFSSAEKIFILNNLSASKMKTLSSHTCLSVLNLLCTLSININIHFLSIFIYRDFAAIFDSLLDCNFKTTVCFEILQATQTTQVPGNSYNFELRLQNEGRGCNY